ncbi:MAG: hypothetical protein V3T81_07770 [Thermoanaerobaculia bacterium]
MPTYFRDDGAPVVEFDPRLEISPFNLFRRLRKGHPLLLMDVREVPRRWTFEGARPFPGRDWCPDSDDEAEVVLFDDDGSEAFPLAQHLQAQGAERVKALFGGLQLYEFSLDPGVVGDETYLVPLPEES